MTPRVSGKSVRKFFGAFFGCGLVFTNLYKANSDARGQAMETETIINVVGTVVLIALLGIYLFVLVPLHRRSERFRRWVNYGLFLWFGSIVAIALLVIGWESIYGRHSRPPQSVIWAALLLGPIILFLWRTGIASGIWRRLPTPLTNGLAAAGRGTARATNVTFEVFATMSSAAIMLIVWIAGIVVLAGVGYLLFIGASKLPVSIAILIGALIIAGAVSSRTR